TRSADEVRDVMPGNIEPSALEPCGTELDPLRRRERQAWEEEINADRQSEDQNERDEKNPQSPHRPIYPTSALRGLRHPRRVSPPCRRNPLKGAATSPVRQATRLISAARAAGYPPCGSAHSTGPGHRVP